MTNKLKFCIAAVVAPFIGAAIFSLWVIIGDYVAVMRHGSNGGGFMVFFLFYVLPLLILISSPLILSIWGLRKNKKWAWLIFYGFVIILLTCSFIMFFVSFFWSSSASRFTSWKILSSISLLIYLVVLVIFSFERKKASNT